MIRAKRYWVVVAAMLFAWSILGVTGCRDAAVKDDSPSDWITFDSDSISLQLPVSFKGGDPRDPAALAELEALATRNPDPEMAVVALSWVEEIRLSVEEGPPSSVPVLEMWSEPDPQGRMAQVMATLGAPRDGWVFQDYVDDFLEVGVEAGAKLEYQTEDRACFVVPDAGPIPGEMILQHCVLVMGNDMPYWVHYTFDDPTNTALAEVFRASANTIRVAH